MPGFSNISNQQDNKNCSANAFTPAGQQPFFRAFIQPKLTVNQPNDVYEQEADTMADKVMRMAEPRANAFFKPAANIVQRKCQHCEEEEKQLQRKETSNEAPSPSSQTENYIQSLSGKGRSLTPSERDFFEPRFGRDFSHVQLHTDAEANQSAKSVNALAYTQGTNIVFGQGQYQPNTEGGKKLMAHELTHVVQQNNMLSRYHIQKCDADEQAQYDVVAGQVRVLPLFQHPPAHRDAIYTPAQVRTVANTIITNARTRDNCLYYIQQLLTLFSTVEQPPSTIGAHQAPILTAASQQEQIRLQDPQAQQDAQFEETASANVPAGNWATLAGVGGTYEVDRTDPAHLVVRLRVHLTGNPAKVHEAQSLEDAIEKKASVAGYTVDLQFVNRDGRDVFTAGVDTNAWATAGNWVGTPDVMAHELHHLLNLPDRYNYIDNQSSNDQMYVANRIHWFEVEFNRAPDPNIERSIMGYGNLITDEDACQVIQPVNPAACLQARQTLRQPAMHARGVATGHILRVKNVLNGIASGSVLDPRDPDSTTSNSSDRVRRIFTDVFGSTLPDNEIDHNLEMIDYFLRTANIQMMTSATQQCHNENLYFQQTPVLAIMVCPGFNGLPFEDKLRELLKLGHLMFQNISGSFALDRALGVPADATAAAKWGTFVVRAFNAI